MPSANTLKINAKSTKKAADMIDLETAGFPVEVDSESARASKMLLDQVLQHMHESVIVTDADLDAPGPRILYVNRAFTDLTGYGSEEVVGQSPRILQGPKSDLSVLRTIKAALIHGREFKGEIIVPENPDVLAALGAALQGR